MIWWSIDKEKGAAAGMKSNTNNKYIMSHYSF